jgi:hypothetical protein
VACVAARISGQPKPTGHHLTAGRHAARRCTRRNHVRRGSLHLASNRPPLHPLDTDDHADAMAALGSVAEIGKARAKDNIMPPAITGVHRIRPIHHQIHSLAADSSRGNPRQSTACLRRSDASFGMSSTPGRNRRDRRRRPMSSQRWRDPTCAEPPSDWRRHRRRRHQRRHRPRADPPGTSPLRAPAFVDLRRIPGRFFGLRLPVVREVRNARRFVIATTERVGMPGYAGRPPRPWPCSRRIRGWTVRPVRKHAHTRPGR